MAKKLKKLPNFLHKSPWLWKSCTQSRTHSFRTPNDIFEDEEFEETPRADMSDDDDKIEALVRGLRSRPGRRLFLELEETNSISTVVEKCEIPFGESVALAMDSKEPYLDFKKSMEEMVEAQGLKDWKGMEMLVCWYLKANAKANHGFIIGAFVDLLVGLAFAHFSCTPCCLCNNSPTSSTSSLVCSSYSFPSSSDSSCSSFRGPNCVISSNSVQITEDIIELENCTSFSTHVAPPCLSSLFEDEEGENEKEDDVEEDL